MFFAWFCAVVVLRRTLLLSVLGFEAGVNDCADESVKAVITFALARFEVDGRVGCGVFELGIESVLPVFQFFFFVKVCESLCARLFPTEVVLKFCALRRCLLEVTRMADGIGFGSALMNDCAAVVAIDLASVDDSTRRECAFNLLNGMLIVDFCHSCVVLVIGWFIGILLFEILCRCCLPTVRVRSNMLGTC